MASSIKKMKEEVRCCFCLGLMIEPVTTECGHNFCRRCIEKNSEDEEDTSSSGSYDCPHCWEELKKRSLPPNKQLENLIKIIREMDREMLCDEHGEQLQLFCKDEGQLICWCCERSAQHRGHNTAPIEHVCPGYKVLTVHPHLQGCQNPVPLSTSWSELLLDNTEEKMHGIVKDLKIDQDYGERVKLLKRKDITDWKEDIEDQRKKIQTEFKNLQSFIHEEEKRYLWRLENEKAEGLSRLQFQEASVEKQTLEFETHILEIKKKCYGSSQNLMKDVDDMEKRFSDVKLKVPESLVLLPKTGSNISKLSNDVKNMFKSSQDQLPSKDP